MAVAQIMTESHKSLVAEGLIDLFSGTWTCTEHDVVVDSATGLDCHLCQPSQWDYSELLLVQSLTG
jgi:hypothetical protein